MRSPILFVLISITTALAGSPCPARKDIYPCSCVNLPKKARLYTTIIHCYRLDDTDQLEKIFTVLSKLQIDRFYLYDSFWEAHKKNVDVKRSLPSDWLAKFNIKEIEIVDTPLSNSFACQNNTVCENTAITRLSITNSSLSAKMDKICTYHEKKNSYNWISCMINLEELELSYGKLSTVNSSFFPIERKKLKRLNLSHNLISSVQKGAFNKVSGLNHLDLSHNRIIGLDEFFATKMDLVTLDVSFNTIKALDKSFFSFLPVLKTFDLKGNKIINLAENHWKSWPSTLRTVNLTDNPLHCHCNIKWMDGSFNRTLTIKGRCHTPKEIQGIYLKQRIKYLAKACDDNGNIQKLKPS